MSKVNTPKNNRIVMFVVFYFVCCLVVSVTMRKYTVICAVTPPLSLCLCIHNSYSYSSSCKAPSQSRWKQ